MSHNIIAADAVREGLSARPSPLNWVFGHEPVTTAMMLGEA